MDINNNKLIKKLKITYIDDTDTIILKFWH